jgi:hypothetical protein
VRAQILSAALSVGAVSAGVQALPLQAPSAAAECATPAGLLAIAARNAGLPGDKIVEAVAIAGAESGFRLNAEKVDWVESSYGPWQVNRDAHPQYSVSELTTADGAARAMVEISGNGDTWQPWTGWFSGAWRNHVAEAESVAHCAGATPQANTVETPAGVIEGGPRGGYQPLPERTVGNLLNATVTGAVDVACKATESAVWAQDACRKVNEAMAGNG